MRNSLVWILGNIIQDIYIREIKFKYIFILYKMYSLLPETMHPSTIMNLRTIIGFSSEILLLGLIHISILL